MWRYILPGAGVVGLTLLLLAGSLASWSFGGGWSPTRQGTPLVAAPAASTLAKLAAASNLSERPASSTPVSEEDAVRLALAALAYVPPASLPTVSASTVLPPAVSPSPQRPPDPASSVAVPLAPTPPTPATSVLAQSRSSNNSQGEAEHTRASTEDLNQQSLDAARAGRVFVSKTVLHGVDGRAQ